MMKKERKQQRIPKFTLGCHEDGAIITLDAGNIELISLKVTPSALPIQDDWREAFLRIDNTIELAKFIAALAARYNELVRMQNESAALAVLAADVIVLQRGNV